MQAAGGQGAAGERDRDRQQGQAVERVGGGVAVPYAAESLADGAGSRPAALALLAAPQLPGEQRARRVVGGFEQADVARAAPLGLFQALELVALPQVVGRA